MRLGDLIGREGDIADRSVLGADIEIAGLTDDSRRVNPGYLFAAVPGMKFDGRTFIAEAIERGATAVLAPPGTVLGPTSRKVSLLTDANPRRRFANLAARFYPDQPDTIAAVTGTNGKTSTVWFLRQIWEAIGRKAACIGTLGVQAPGVEISGSLTTPDPVTLHRTLSGLARSGIQRAAMEASSHGLAQWRLDGVRVTTAAFTNLTRDHLDYHGTMEVYLEAKLRLFTEILEPGSTVVLNADGPYFDAVNVVCVDHGHRVLTYGEKGEDVRIEAVDPTVSGQRVRARVFGKTQTLELPLVGRFQVDNAMCALATAVASGENPVVCTHELRRLNPVPGRMQCVECDANGASIFVDFAHTPDALSNVLRALRSHVVGRLIVVFGCGGDRDRGKRPVMGKLAATFADEIIVTDDNPRTEDPALIRAQILAACSDAKEIGDRREAIGYGVSRLQSGDILLIAGKGHERGQKIGDEVHPFDDAEVVRDVCRAAGIGRP